MWDLLDASLFIHCNWVSFYADAKNKSNIKPMHIFILKKMMKQFYSSSDIWIVFVLMECWLQSSDVISKSYEYYTIQSAYTYTYTRVVHCISLEHKLFTCIESFHSKIIMIIMEKTKKKRLKWTNYSFMKVEKAKNME